MTKWDDVPAHLLPEACISTLLTNIFHLMRNNDLNTAAAQTFFFPKFHVKMSILYFFFCLSANNNMLFDAVFFSLKHSLKM